SPPFTSEDILRENVSANSTRLIPEAIASTHVTDRSRDGRLEIFPRGSWKTHQAANVTFSAILIASNFAGKLTRTFRYSQTNLAKRSTTVDRSISA
ncbi:hypothetical protein ALC60_01794, partial [Trachymyrmex zeteki]